jgi:Tol biopolymer transport system component
MGNQRQNGPDREISPALSEESNELSLSTRDVFDTVIGKIVFVSNRDGNNEIYSMNGDGSQQTRLTYNLANDVAPRWSPNGEWIVFLSDRTGYNQFYIMDANGNNQTLLPIQGVLASGPLWAPNGNWIAFSKAAEDVNIYLIKPDGSQEFQLSYNAGYSLPVAWSPDSDNILFISNLDIPGQAVSVNDLFSINVETGEVSNITNYPAQYADASWSSDGQLIVYVDGRNSILILRDLLKTQEEILISNQLNFLESGTPYELHPDWLPDNQHIVFTWNKDGNDEIYVINSINKKLYRLTENIFADFDPDWWSP